MMFSVLEMMQVLWFMKSLYCRMSRVCISTALR